MSFAAKNMGKNIGKSISKNLSGKYSQKLLTHAKKSATDVLKTTSKRVIQKTSKATGDLISNKIADKITKPQKFHHKIIQKRLQMNMINEIPNERYIFPKERQKIIDDLRLI